MVDHVELTDPRAMRAYAHPTRLALVSLLRREGPKTATQAAEAVGESVASCSFHFRQLAKYGLVVAVEGQHGRAKPWRATAMFTTWRADAADAETSAAATHLDAVILDRYCTGAQGWLARRGEEPIAWRRAALSSDYVLHLTASELTRLGERIEGLLEEFLPRQADPSLRPKGARAVILVQLAFPRSQS